MKKMMAISKITAAAVLASMLLAGCGKSDAQTEASETLAVKETESVKESETLVQETEQTLGENQMYSYLTGEVVDKAVGEKRPVALMVNNIEDATPQQAGLSQADVLYEAVVEGDITRLLAVFEDTADIEKVGSIRSARHYYIDFANDNDAIYCHYGWSKFAQDRITQDGMKTVSQNVGSAYFQDNNYAAPHHIFASGETLEAGIAEIGVDRNYPEGYEGHFKFNTEDTDLGYGTIANKVDIPFVLSSCYLEYDSTDKVYKKYQYGGPQLDANNGEQLAFKNVIVQKVAYSSMGTPEGHQDLKLDGSGEAVYITDGKAVNITWTRESSSDQTKYYYEDGTQVKMNPGKTYIAVVPTTFDITLSE